jgi:hypothetical protein
MKARTRGIRKVCPIRIRVNEIATIIRIYAALAKLVVEIPFRDGPEELLNVLTRLPARCSLALIL